MYRVLLHERLLFLGLPKLYIQNYYLLVLLKNVSVNNKNSFFSRRTEIGCVILAYPPNLVAFEVCSL